MRTRIVALIIGLTALLGLAAVTPAATAAPATTAASGYDTISCPKDGSGTGWSDYHCAAAVLNAQPSVGTAKVDANVYLSGVHQTTLNRLDSLNGHLKTWALYCGHDDGTSSARQWTIKAYHVTQADMNAAGRSICPAGYNQSRAIVLVDDTWNGCGPYETVINIPAAGTIPGLGTPPTVLGTQPWRTSSC